MLVLRVMEWETEGVHPSLPMLATLHMCVLVVPRGGWGDCNGLGVPLWRLLSYCLVESEGCGRGVRILVALGTPFFAAKQQTNRSGACERDQW